MTFFWTLSGALLALVLLMLLRPLLGARPGRDAARERMHVRALKRDLAAARANQGSGELSDADYQARCRALADGFLDSVEQDRSNGTTARRQNRLVAILVLLAVPVGAVWLYQQLGAGEVAFRSLQAVAPADDGGMPAQTGEAATASVDELLVGLQQRLSENPEDQQGWELLGRSYIELGRFEEAVNAYRQLYQLAGDQPTVMILYAEALARSRESDLQGEPTALVEKALAIEPDNQRGLWLSGLIAFQQGDGQTALGRWRRLLALLPEGSSVAEGLAEQISQAEARLGLPGSSSSDTTPKQAPVEVAGPLAGAPSVLVAVDLAPDLNGRVGADDTLFVYARAVNGPRMPLAMARHTAGELPLQVRLDDSMSMTPAMTLSAFPTVEIVARVSRSGTATPQSGDLIGVSDPIEVGRQDQTTVRISRTVP